MKCISRKGINFVITGLVSSSLLFGAWAPAASAADMTNTSMAYKATIAHDPRSTIDEEGLVEGFKYIENIPNSAFTSEDAFSKYVNSHPLPGNPPSTSVGGFRQMNPIACGSAIGTALVGSLPPAKIFKIKSTIKGAGGAIKFGKSFKAAFDKAKDAGKSKSDAMKAAAKEASKDAGPDVQQALLDFFGLGNVAASCGIGD